MQAKSKACNLCIGLFDISFILIRLWCWDFSLKLFLNSFKEKSQYQRPKPRVKTQAQMQKPTRIFDILERVCIDVGTVPWWQQKFLLMVDDASKFVLTVPMKDETADFIRWAIWNKWTPYLGVPYYLHSEQASSVDGTTVRELCTMLGIDKSWYSPYQLQNQKQKSC